jgi:Protein of unknown function DUF115
MNTFGIFWAYFKETMAQILSISYKKDYYLWKYRYAPALAKYRNIHAGEDCFIIANGPSLKQTNMAALQDYYCIGLNKSHLLKESFGVQIDYHICVDDVILEQMDEIFKQNILGCPSFLSYNASLFRKLKLINHPAIHYIFTEAPWSFYKDFTQPICEGYTVTYVALQMAYFMGFKRVFLVGVDHNWQDQVVANKIDDYKGEDKNHFHPDYFKNMKWHMPDIKGNEGSYALARHQYDAAGRSVLDATIGGKLQVFPKIAFEEALQLCKKKNG